MSFVVPNPSRKVKSKVLLSPEKLGYESLALKWACETRTGVLRDALKVAQSHGIHVIDVDGYTSPAGLEHMFVLFGYPGGKALESEPKLEEAVKAFEKHQEEKREGAQIQMAQELFLGVEMTPNNLLVLTEFCYTQNVVISSLQMCRYNKPPEVAGPLSTGAGFDLFEIALETPARNPAHYIREIKNLPGVVLVEERDGPSSFKAKPTIQKIGMGGVNVTFESREKWHEKWEHC